jgi:hypothetical protein
MMAAAAAGDAAAKRKRPSVCHSCKAVVVWVILEGKRQPLDWLPAGGGDVALEPELFARDDREDGLARARIISGITTHYQRHIKSCPDAGVWREAWKKKTGGSFSKMKKGKQR